jgi:hypothetical protein
VQVLLYVSAFTLVQINDTSYAYWQSFNICGQCAQAFLVYSMIQVARMQLLYQTTDSKDNQSSAMTDS